MFDTVAGQVFTSLPSLTPLLVGVKRYKAAEPDRNPPGGDRLEFDTDRHYCSIIIIRCYRIALTTGST